MYSQRLTTGMAFLMCALAIVLVHAAPTHALDCDTLPPRPPIEFDSIAAFQFNGGANCWGWIAPDGEEYAIMGTGDGIDVVRISTMSHVAHAPMQACSWRELKTYRNYCYVVSECTGAPNAGMMIVDLSYLPDSVHVVGTYAPAGNVRSHCISIDTARGYAYLVRQNYTGFRIVSLANPESPVDVGSVTTGDLHDMTAFNDTVYAAEGNDGAFSIWNCANKGPGGPVNLATVTIPGGGYVHNLWPTADRRFIASTEELPDFRTMKMWNMENKANIFMVDEYIGPGGIPHNAHIEGNHLYLAHYSSGVSVLDITYPECMQEVAMFDTYEPSNAPNFVGCWGVYPHTAGRQTVYASNMDGRFFIFRTSIIATDFSGAPTLGGAPLNVDFSDSSPTADTWKWYFGDGDSSSVQNPSHVYDPGIYTVELKITTATGEGTELKPNYVTALAETLKVADTSVGVNTSVVWEIWHQNNVPIEEIKLPIALSGVPAYAAFDSISTVGCRTSYFEQKQLVFDNRGNGQAAIRLNADNGGGAAPLTPGNGPIARIHFRVKNVALPGQQVVLTMPTMGVSQHSLQAFTTTTQYVPELIGAVATVVNTCDCSCHGDPVCDGQPDIQDVVETINNAFRGTAPTIDASCPHVGRSDVDCSGAIDIVDVVNTVNVVFRGADMGTTYCDPCNP